MQNIFLRFCEYMIYVRWLHGWSYDKLLSWTSLTLADQPTDQHLTWWQSATIFLRHQFTKVFKHILNFQLMQLRSWYPTWQWFFIHLHLRCWVIVAVDGWLCPNQQCVGKFIKMNENKVVGSTFKTFFLTLMSPWPTKQEVCNSVCSCSQEDTFIFKSITPVKPAAAFLCIVTAQINKAKAQIILCYLSHFRASRFRKQK